MWGKKFVDCCSKIDPPTLDFVLTTVDEKSDEKRQKSDEKRQKSDEKVGKVTRKRTRGRHSA
jgi:hypothetical protein